MVNVDIMYRFKQLRERVDAIENIMKQITAEKPLEKSDWDNSTLMREWQISERTAANYRIRGLEYYKIGGRIYYTAEQRSRFIEQSGIKRLIASQSSSKEVRYENK